MEDYMTIYSSNVVNFTNFDQVERRRSLINIIWVSVLPVEVIVGVLANIWAFAVIVRRRLCLQHEGYVYLGAILITNALILALYYVSMWFSHLDESYAITRKADFLCKAWNFFFNGFYCTGWLVLALLFNVCLRRGREEKEGEIQTSNYRSLVCALIVTLSLIFVTLLLNIWQLVSFEMHEYYNEDTSTTEYYCVFTEQWQPWILGTLVAVHSIYGLPIVFILPVLFILIACSGCACTGCKYGTKSGEHFPRGTLLSLAAIVYFLHFPSTVWQQFGSFLFGGYRYNMLLSIMFCATTLVNGFVFTVIPILCIAAMPKLRQATFKADCCSCNASRKHEIEAIALRETEPENGVLHFVLN